MKKIVILGAGFGGIRAALDLEKKLKGKAEITLIDKNNFHLFTPALYEVATAHGVKKDKYNTVLKGSISIPLNRIFEGKKVNVVQAQVEEIDLDKKIIKTTGDNGYEYDYLMVALGAETSFFGIPGVREYAYNLKNINDAVQIYKRIDEIFEILKNDGGITHPVRFIIIGGGFTGVEVAAELACCVRNKAKTCHLEKDCTKVSLIEASSRILGPISESERKIIKKRLDKLGVKIIENSPVTEVRVDRVTTARGESFDADLIIWSGGITGPSLLKKMGESGKLELNKKGMTKVNKYLQADNYKDLFIVGDAAEIFDEKNKVLVPALAYTAVQQGAVVASNIAAVINSKGMKAYKPFYNVWVAPVGGKWALAHIGKGKNITGFLGWITRIIIDLRYFLSILSPWKALKLVNKNIVIFSGND